MCLGVYLSELFAFSGTWICIGRESAHRAGYRQLSATEEVRQNWEMYIDAPVSVTWLMAVRANNEIISAAY